MSNSRQIASLPNILTLIDDAGGQFIKQQAAGVTTSYTITWPSAVGSSGAVLALTDGSGGLGWQSTLGIALSGGTVNNSIIGGSTPAAITGTTITANTAFVGPLTGNSTTATALASGRTFSFTGDATGTSASFDGSANVSTSLTLAASGVSAASYGSATAIPVITVDAKGRITSASTAAISSTLTIGADSGSNDTITIGTDTLNFVGTGSEIETTVSDNQIQIGLPSTVSGLTTVSATNLQGALAGTIASTTTGTTQAASDNSTKIATTAYVTTALNNLIDSAPGALNTLNELAAAMGDDANFSTTVTNSIATKLALAGGTLTGNVIFGDNVKALFGTGSDLEIYHDGSNSYLVDAGTGGILYRGGTQTFQNAAGSKTMAVLNGATSVDLYYDNSKKFETTSGGIAVTGTATATTFSATTLTGTLSTAAQPNVTSVGTLSSLTVSGALNATLATAAQTNITSLGTLTGLTVNGTANATTFVGALTGNVTGNVSGSAATVTGAAQTNITSLGTLSSLTVSGDVTIDTSTLKVDTSNNRVGILNASPDVTLDIGSATDSIHIPVGTTAQRPGSPAAGYFRYNSSLNQFEGYTSAWGAIGGGGTNTFNHNVFTGDGSETEFALAAATESENNLLVFIDGVFQEQGAYSIATSSGTTTLTMSAAPASGRKLVVYQVSAGVSGNNLNIDTMTGDGSDTTLTLSIAPVNENNTQVYFDGVYQHKSTYSISGTTLTFSTAPPTGVEVEAMTFTQTEVNVPVNDTIDSVHIKDNAVTAGKLAASLNLSSNTITLPAVAIPSASTATTQAASDNTTKVATTAYVTTAISNLIDGAPGTLNTLNELAAALADDASFSSTITTSLAAKANLAAPNFTGNVTFDTTTLTVDASNNRVGIGTASPASALDIRTSHTSTDVTAANSNQTLIVGNTGSGNGVYNAIKFAGNQQDMYLMSFNNSTQASRRLGFFVGSVAGDAVADERLSILGNGNVGIGTTSSGYPLEVQSGGSGTVFRAGTSFFSVDATGSASSPSLIFNGDANTGFYRSASDTIKFSSGGSDVVTLGSTVDIAGKLSLNDATYGGWIQSNTSVRIDIDNDNNQTDRAFIVSKNNADSTLFIAKEDGTVGIGGTESNPKSFATALGVHGSTNSGLYLHDDNAGRYGYLEYDGNNFNISAQHSAGTLNLKTNDTTRLTINSSGTVGIGTTDIHTWATFDGRLRIGARGFFGTTTASNQMGYNWYYDGDYKYIAADFANRYYQNGGNHIWETAASGSADGTITWSEKLRIDSSGNVGIGATPETDWNSNYRALQLNTAGAISSYASGSVFGTAISTNQRTTGNTFIAGNKYIASAAAALYLQDNEGGHYWYNAASGTADATISWNERMRIDSSGNVGIGRAPASGYKLDIAASSSSTANLLRLRNSSTGASATAKMLFSLNRTGSSVDYEAGSIEVRKDQSWTTAPSTIDSHMRFITVNNESVTEKMRILANGAVVIGGGNGFAQQGGGLLTLEGPDADMLVLHRTADTGDQAIKFMDHGDLNAVITGRNGGHLTFQTGGNNFCMHMVASGEARFGTETVARQTMAPVNSRKNGATIEFGHGNNTAGYFGTVGCFGNNGHPYIGFSCASELAANTFSTFGHAGNIIRGNLSGDLHFMKVANPNATGQTPARVAAINANGTFHVAYSGTADTTGYFYAGKDFSATNHRINRATTQGNAIFVVSAYGGSLIQADTALFYAVKEGFANSSGTAISVGRSDTNDRSINAGGSVNTGGNDYAEYMEKKSTDFDIAKGDICGVDATGKLTNKFSEAHSFVVKTTKPAFVGGDIWGSEDAIGLKPLLTKQRIVENNEDLEAGETGDEVSETDEEYAVRVAQYETDLAAHEAALEAQRIKYDRIAFSGQVPVNVTGATVGDYIIPKEATSDSITGEAVSSPSFEQYQLAVGKVWKILDDGRAFISVKIG